MRQFAGAKETKIALLPCYECGTTISTAAPACPSCGAPNKMKVEDAGPKAKPSTRPAFKLLAFILIGVFTYALFSKEDASVPAALPDGPAISVEAEKLAADYKDNEVSADNTYKEKRLIVSAVVQSINKDFKDQVWVGMRTDNQFTQVHAEGLTATQASKLKKGEVITVICKGAGMILSSPFLKDCILPKSSKN